jgi:hypothetical protein
MKRVKLQDVADVELGRQIDPNRDADHSLRVYRAEGQSESLGKSHAMAGKLPRGYSEVREGDLMVSISAIHEVVRRVSALEAGSALVFPWARISVRDGAVVSRDWCASWMASTDFAQQVSARSRGTARGRITVRDLRNLTIPVPASGPASEPLATVQSIHRALELAESQVEALQRLLRIEADLVLASETIA